MQIGCSLARRFRCRICLRGPAFETGFCPRMHREHCAEGTRAHQVPFPRAPDILPRNISSGPVSGEPGLEAFLRDGDYALTWIARPWGVCRGSPDRDLTFPGTDLVKLPITRLRGSQGIVLRQTGHFPTGIQPNDQAQPQSPERYVACSDDVVSCFASLFMLQQQA